MRAKRTTINLEPSTHALLQELQAIMDSPSLGSVVYFLALQNKSIPPAERTNRTPKYHPVTFAETQATPPLHSIQVGDDTYHTLKKTKDLYGLRSWDAAISRYLYKPTENTPAQEETISELNFKINELKATIAHLTREI